MRKNLLITALFCSPDEVGSIGFHQDRPVVAFGSSSGCVHLFSLSWHWTICYDNEEWPEQHVLIDFYERTNDCC